MMTCVSKKYEVFVIVCELANADARTANITATITISAMRCIKVGGGGGGEGGAYLSASSQLANKVYAYDHKQMKKKNFENVCFFLPIALSMNRPSAFIVLSAGKISTSSSLKSVIHYREVLIKKRWKKQQNDVYSIWLYNCFVKMLEKFSSCLQRRW